MENDELDFDVYEIEDQEFEHDMEEFESLCREMGDWE